MKTSRLAIKKILVSLFSLLLLLPAAGCRSTSSTALKTYMDVTCGLSFDYPSDWELTVKQNVLVTSIGLKNPNGSSGFFLNYAPNTAEQKPFADRTVQELLDESDSFWQLFIINGKQKSIIGEIETAVSEINGNRYLRATYETYDREFDLKTSECYYITVFPDWIVSFSMYAPQWVPLEQASIPMSVRSSDKPSTISGEVKYNDKNLCFEFMCPGSWMIQRNDYASGEMDMWVNTGNAAFFSLAARPGKIKKDYNSCGSIELSKEAAIFFTDYFSQLKLKFAMDEVQPCSSETINDNRYISTSWHGFGLEPGGCVTVKAYRTIRNGIEYFLTVQYPDGCPQPNVDRLMKIVKSFKITKP